MTNTKQTDRTQAHIVKVRPFWDHRKDHTKLASSDTLYVGAERDDPLMNDLPLINANKGKIFMWKRYFPLNFGMRM